MLYYRSVVSLYCASALARGGVMMLLVMMLLIMLETSSEDINFSECLASIGIKGHSESAFVRPWGEHALFQ